jgi:hypothetical protein
MKLRLERKEFTEDSTIGDFYVNDSWFAFSLEDTVREPGVKVVGKTAIPAGNYEVIVDYSNRFKRRLPRLIDVPMFEGIRIHSGNKPADTEGCILLGMTKDKDFIGQSRSTVEAFIILLDKGLAEGKVFIDIGNKEV